MKIHDILRQVTEPGMLLTYEEIKQRVLDAFPGIKSRSIVPSEHIAGKKGVCKLCHRWPVFEKLEHGLYRVLPDPEQEALPIHAQLAQVLATQAGRTLSVAEIRALVTQAFPDTHPPSVIPLDHTLGGACRSCQDAPLLERSRRRGHYLVLAQTHKPAVIDGHGVLTAAQLAELCRQLEKNPPERLHLQLQPFLEALGAQPLLPQRELNLLASGVRERVVVDLLEFGTLLEPDLLRARLVQRLYEHQGLRLELAQWTVDAWRQILAESRGFQYPKSQVSLALPMAEVPRHLPTEDLVGLKYLQWVPFKRGVSWLKKQRHRIALLVQLDTAYWLGIRKVLLPPDWPWSPAALPKGQLPSGLTPAEQQAFDWFQLPDQASLQQALHSLDQNLGPSVQD